LSVSRQICQEVKLYRSSEQGYIAVMSDIFNNNDHLRQGFVRQRRNLMAVSFVLFFLLYGDVEIPQLSILGNEIIFGDADKLENIFLIVWGYLYYRYYVYFRDLKDGGYSGVFYSHFQKNIKDEILKIVQDNPTVTQNVNIYEKYDNYCMGRVELKEDSEYGGRSETDDIKVEGWPFKKSKLNAHIFTFAHTRYFTEYTLPFIIGLVPLITLIYQEIFN